MPPSARRASSLLRLVVATTAKLFQRSHVPEFSPRSRRRVTTSCARPRSTATISAYGVGDLVPVDLPRTAFHPIPLASLGLQPFRRQPPWSPLHGGNPPSYGRRGADGAALIRLCQRSSSTVQPFCFTFNHRRVGPPRTGSPLPWRRSPHSRIPSPSTRRQPA